jgi:hypothetical protein
MAVADLRRQLERSLMVIVRRTMRTRIGNSVLTRHILAEADRVGEPEWQCTVEERERLIGRVARRVCEAVIENLRGKPRVGLPANETVCS